METVSTVALLTLVALFVLFAARWRPRLRPLPIPTPALDKVPIAAATGDPLTRGAFERETAMREALRTSGRIPKREWAEYEPNLLLIHDDLTEEDLARLMERFGGSELSEAVSTPEEGSARERFRARLAARGEDQIEPLGTHFAPGPFDAYRIKPTRSGERSPR
ncbi:hypothetical protein EON77_09745 [bacterium]|nr:MAG: hypothetical protein EON77_09745 [bacterium]